ncbi:MAG: hypothetical protein ABW019_12550 [Chitinophagaceae bacterium]
MKDNKILLTRKIQLLIHTQDPAIRRQTRETLWQWQRICHRAANYIYTHQYIQEQVKDLFYFTDGVRARLANIRQDEDGILTTSRLNTTYQLLSRHFKGQMPMSILSCLNKQLVCTFGKERDGLWKGERSLRSFRRDIPMPIAPADLRQIKTEEGGRFYTCQVFGHAFRLYFGKKGGDKRAIWEAALRGEYKLRTSSIQVEEHKIFLLATFEVSKDDHALQPEVVAEATLSMEIPIRVKIGRHSYAIGTKEDFLYRRLAIQQALHRCQQSATYNRSANGLARKLQHLERYRGAEKRYVNYKLHVYSRRLIDLCIRHRVATLLLTGQQQQEAAAKEEEFLLRNWSYYSLKEKIAYKARKAGIALVVE